MNELAKTVSDVEHDINDLHGALSKIIVGQDELLRNLLIAVFAKGHVLLEGLPGLGKTHLAKSLAAAIGVQLGRVQCTPDLLPADITGSDVLSGDAKHVEFRPGPVFANLVLVDEINRATPRTQAALLEAMQEQQVTYAGTSYELPSPFWIIATQNPIELEGTFPLPEAQLDRFLFKIDVAYPSAESLDELLQTSLDDEPGNTLEPVLSKQRVHEITRVAREVLVSEPVRKAAIRLILGTQPESEHALASATQHIRYGASPRALQALIRAARVRALFAGRVQVDFDDLQAIAVPVLSHRILMKTVSELDGVTVASLVEGLVAAWRDELGLTR